MVTPYQTAEQSITSTNNIPPAINNNRPTLPIMLRPDAASSDDFTTSCDDNIIRTYTARDVLNGRGQGVQRHPGNVKYRTLVFVNKVSRLNKGGVLVHLFHHDVFRPVVACDECIWIHDYQSGHNIIWSY